MNSPAQNHLISSNANEDPYPLFVNVQPYNAAIAAAYLPRMPGNEGGHSPLLDLNPARDINPVHCVPPVAFPSQAVGLSPTPFFDISGDELYEQLYATGPSPGPTESNFGLFSPFNSIVAPQESDTNQDPKPQSKLLNQTLSPGNYRVYEDCQGNKREYWTFVFEAILALQRLFGDLAVLATKPDEEPRYKCGICIQQSHSAGGKRDPHSLHRRWDLSPHILTHAFVPIKPWFCECGKAYARSHDLKRHQDSCNGKPLKTAQRSRCKRSPQSNASPPSLPLPHPSHIPVTGSFINEASFPIIYPQNVPAPSIASVQPIGWAYSPYLDISQNEVNTWTPSEKEVRTPVAMFESGNQFSKEAGTHTLGLPYRTSSSYKLQLLAALLGLIVASVGFVCLLQLLGYLGPHCFLC
ncbi:hypothetical protein FRC19_000246 [Serendipita sp. 401]|nr:hypothetical protein FRC15_009972 [Serendipita sp. 397]KAG8828858.1 hypothetical protein FRC19_000246 [Serendipita sp. 401]KAG8871756.1 hypothetical protein FRC20_010201 [Serendipita sp. 405]KAG9056370.1 hypothetical protein FS842_010886 [Serendipita sp. 407]